MKIIIITGPSGSGKTNLSKKLLAKLENSHLLSTDDFYKTGMLSNIRSYFIRSYFDKEISHDSKLLRKTISKILKNKKINYSYKYNFINKSTKIIYQYPSFINYLIIEGIFTLELLKFISNNNYLLIRLKTSMDICIKRIYKRDYLERGKSKKDIIKDFKRAWEIYQKKEELYKISENSNELIFKNDPNINTIIKKLSNNNL